MFVTLLLVGRQCGLVCVYTELGLLRQGKVFQSGSRTLTRHYSGPDKKLLQDCVKHVNKMAKPQRSCSHIAVFLTCFNKVNGTLLHGLKSGTASDQHTSGDVEKNTTHLYIAGESRAT
uniref:Uncharacterized protein n=2 Tax=Timema TaxID=61471 RepID=A0A7R9IS27_9NEOP|nr:unnamed protein product [Timema bartmani]CAD7463568.1 unnamed protein product [Timema tahoe]